MSIRIDLMDDSSENVLYDDIEYSVYIRRSRLSNYPSYAAPPHWHDNIEFIMVLSGSMAYNVNGEIIEL